MSRSFRIPARSVSFLAIMTLGLLLAGCMAPNPFSAPLARGEELDFAFTGAIAPGPVLLDDVMPPLEMSRALTADERFASLAAPAKDRPSRTVKGLVLSLDRKRARWLTKSVGPDAAFLSADEVDRIFEESAGLPPDRVERFNLGLDGTDRWAGAILAERMKYVSGFEIEGSRASLIADPRVDDYEGGTGVAVRIRTPETGMKKGIFDLVLLRIRPAAPLAEVDAKFMDSTLCIEVPMIQHQKVELSMSIEDRCGILISGLLGADADRVEVVLVKVGK